MHLLALSIFLYHLTSFSLVSSRRLKRVVEDPTLGTPGLDYLDLNDSSSDDVNPDDPILGKPQ